MEINFKGEKIIPKYNDVKAKLMNLKKNAPPPAEDLSKKDPKKKDDKKQEQVQPEKVEPALKYNKKIEAAKLEQVNGADCSLSYQIPEFEPYIFLIE